MSWIPLVITAKENGARNCNLDCEFESAQILPSAASGQGKNLPKGIVSHPHSAVLPPYCVPCHHEYFCASLVVMLFTSPYFPDDSFLFSSVAGVSLDHKQREVAFAKKECSHIFLFSLTFPLNFRRQTTWLQPRCA